MTPIVCPECGGRVEMVHYPLVECIKRDLLGQGRIGGCGLFRLDEVVSIPYSVPQPYTTIVVGETVWGHTGPCGTGCTCSVAKAVS